MTFERVVRQTFDAIQFDGSNLKEVYDFICANHGNANHVTFDELLENHRPDEIPLDVNSGLEAYDMERNFKERWRETLNGWRDYQRDHPYKSLDDYEKDLPVDFIRDRRLVRLYRQDWRENELYHFYLTSGEFCKLIGICKGDWFTTDGGPIKHCSEGYFKSLCEDDGWKPVE